jgi:hypothetical protein
VASLQKQVDRLKALGYSDGSFPCLTSQGSSRDQQLHVVGILALNELQHVLGENTYIWLFAFDMLMELPSLTR